MKNLEEISQRILDFLDSKQQGASGSQIAEALGVKRLSLAKDLEVLRAFGVIDYQQVGAAKLWFKGKGTPTNTLLEDLLFRELPAHFEKQPNNKAAAKQLNDLAYRVMTNALKSDSAIRDRISEYSSIYEWLLLSYKYVGGFHKKFDAELLEETDEKLVVRINVCPHEKYTKNNPLACSACNGFKKAILEELCDITKPISASKQISKGDPYCQYVIQKK